MFSPAQKPGGNPEILKLKPVLLPPGLGRSYPRAVVLQSKLIKSSGLSKTSSLGICNPTYPPIIPIHICRYCSAGTSLTPHVCLIASAVLHGWTKNTGILVTGWFYTSYLFNMHFVLDHRKKLTPILMPPMTPKSRNPNQHSSGTSKEYTASSPRGYEGGISRSKK